MSEDNVKIIPTHHIDSYTAAAEQFKVDLYNLCVTHLNDDFPVDWVIGILEDTKLALVLDLE